MNQQKEFKHKLQALEEQHITARKRRLKLEAEMCKVKRLHLMDVEELKVLEAGISNNDAALQRAHCELSALRCQLGNVSACGASESIKMDARIKAINRHSREFHDLFERERRQAELRFKEQQEREREQREREKARNSELEKNNKEDLEMAISVETKCGQLEQECAVLKKRNAAILLLLRKNLFKAETKRRNLMQQDQQ